MIRSATPASSWCAVKAPAWWSIASTSVVLPWSTCATIATFLRSERVEGMAVRRRFRRRGLTPDRIGRTAPGPHRRRAAGGGWSPVVNGGVVHDRDPAEGDLRGQLHAAEHLGRGEAYTEPTLSCPEGRDP